MPQVVYCRLDESMVVPQWESIEKPELYLPEDPATAAEVDRASGRNSAGGEWTEPAVATVPEVSGWGQWSQQCRR